MGLEFDLFAFTKTAWMLGYTRIAIDDTHRVQTCENAQCFLDLLMWNRVIVEIKADIGWRCLLTAGL